MPKDTITYTLFIAAPGDITNEKAVIRKLSDEWNIIRGKFKGIQLKVVDWSDTYPLYGDRPQAIINEQIFDDSDLVVSIFWTKYGQPTGVAASGTEEEILRAIDQKKPLMLYFSDVPLPPSRTNADDYASIVAFRKAHENGGLYRVFSSHEEFEKMFRLNLAEMMNKILSAKVNTTDAPDKKENEVEVEVDENKGEYKPFKEIEHVIRENFNSYWTRLFGIIEPKSTLPNGMKISSLSNNKDQVKEARIKVAEWNSRIEEYTWALQDKLTKIDYYANDEFKHEIFAKELWTVSGALNNRDQELARYRHAYDVIESYKIKDTTKNILRIVSEYESSPPKLTKSPINPSSFEYDRLTAAETLLTNVIGKGIRSEILHKMNPSLFPLMTRRSIWGLFFLSNQESEFVVDQNYNGQWRTVHNWDYKYDYFAYYNHVIFQLMSQFFLKHKIKLNPDYKYGYANLFLVELYKHHAKQIDEFKRYKDLGI